MFSSTNNGDSWELATGIAASDTIVKIMFDYPLVIENAGPDTRVLAGSDDGNIYEAFRNSRYLTATLLAIFEGEFSGIFIAYLEDQNKKVHGVLHFPSNNQGGGLQVSTDNGANWTQNNNGLPNSNTSALSGFQLLGSIKYHVGLFDNMNGGARIFSMNYSVTDVKPVSTPAPDNYKLQQNYPNPFNPTTKIQYSIPSESFVELMVYDVLGNEVAALVNEQQQAGIYIADFNAENFPSGMYFARITANEFKQVVKMILLK